jgi:pimeloyl-ACP methyl ester carboxylesterase
MPRPFPALLLLALLPGQPPAHAVQTRFVAVAPAYDGACPFPRSAGRRRAVVLLHGLHPHPFSKERVRQPLFGTWQLPDSPLVRRLAGQADVFAFAYGQNAAVDEVAADPALADGVRLLRRLGYREVVLVGHSAGGVIARLFAEDHPDAGVTKVVQVCPPNGGSSWARLPAVRADQRDFVDSLSKSARQRAALLRADKRLPGSVEFVCVMGTSPVGGDGVVQARCQWTEELQAQGVPAYPVRTTHWDAMRTPRVLDLIDAVVREPQPRWPEDQVAAARRQLLGR